MNETAGRIIHIAQENEPVPGCTVSKQLYRQQDYSMFFFSMAGGTEISAESYQYPKIFIMYEGEMEIFDTKKRSWQIKTGECFVLPQIFQLEQEPKMDVYMWKLIFERRQL